MILSKRVCALARSMVFFAVMSIGLSACPVDSQKSDKPETKGCISGNISSSVTDCPAHSTADDCRGTLYIGVFDDVSLSPDSLVVSTQLTDLDLSGGGPVAYEIANMEPGSWHLAAFLDDDNNAVEDSPQPDEGDLVSDVASIAITITAGETASADQQFTIRLPATGDPCANESCSDHGDCQVAGGLAVCECDHGYAPSGLRCVDIDPQPPTELACPAPGDLSGTLATQLISGRWYYAANDRSCTISSWTLYEFRADGVFWMRRQTDLDQVGGGFEYGCWSYSASTATRLSINYNYESTTTLNCGALGRSEDPPCTAVLEYVDGDIWFQGATFDWASEKHVFRRAGLPVCGWCSDEASCCPDHSWTEDQNGVVCP